MRCANCTTIIAVRVRYVLVNDGTGTYLHFCNWSCLHLYAMRKCVKVVRIVASNIDNKQCTQCHSTFIAGDEVYANGAIHERVHVACYEQMEGR